MYRQFVQVALKILHSKQKGEHEQHDRFAGQSLCYPARSSFHETTVSSRMLKIYVKQYKFHAFVPDSLLEKKVRKILSFACYYTEVPEKSHARLYFPCFSLKCAL